MAHKLVEKLTGLKAAYVREHRKDPTIVRIDQDDEMDFLALSGHYSSDEMKKMQTQGVRAAVTTVLGMQVEWDAATTSVA